jgi:hypothetical protein
MKVLSGNEEFVMICGYVSVFLAFTVCENSQITLNIPDLPKEINR